VGKRIEVVVRDVPEGVPDDTVVTADQPDPEPEQRQEFA
jgi:hypothetical protein